jgi:hypothetical protein
MTNDKLKQLYISRVEARSRDNFRFLTKYVVVTTVFLFYLIYLSGLIAPFIPLAINLILVFLNVLINHHLLTTQFKYIDESFKEKPEAVLLTLHSKKVTLLTQIILCFIYASVTLLGLSLLIFIIEILV